MANKNILVSSNGKYEPISASVDDATGVLSSSLSVTANTSSFVAQSGLMQVYGGKLMPVGNTSINPPSDGIYSGSVLTYNNSEGFAPSRTSAAAFNGDISGDVDSGIKVRSVSNVTGGLLPLAYGGTGAGSFSTNSLITTSGSGLVPSVSNKIVVGSSNSYVSGDTALLNFLGLSEAVVYLYTGVVSASPYTTQQATQVNVDSSTFTWTKPAGCKFIRIICQGGGGAGAGKWSSAGTGCHMTGGGGGGYADVLFSALNIPSTVSISAGNGPPGFNTLTGFGFGLGGGHSSFGNYIISYGGLGGAFFNTGTASINAAGGIGYLSIGGVGGARGGGGASVAIGGAGGGCSGVSFSGGYAGGSITYIGATGGAGGAAFASGQDGISKNNFNFKKYYVPINSTQVSLSSNPFPALVCGGGGGSGRNGGNGGSADYGSGGGGAGNYSGAPYGVGGNGGKGYVLIICY